MEYSISQFNISKCLACILIIIYSNNPFLASNSTKICARLLSTLFSKSSSSLMNFPILFPISSRICCCQKNIGKPEKIAHTCWTLCGSFLAFKSMCHFLRIKPKGPQFQLSLSNRELSSSFANLNKNHPYGKM